MAAKLEHLIPRLHLGDPLRFERLTIVPLTFDARSDLDYLTIDEGTEEQLIEITEVDESGSVPEMKVSNRSDRFVLAPDGSTLTGSKQNRVVNLSILFAPNSESVIPVSCVEQGRWRASGRGSSPREHSDQGLRRKMCRSTSESLKRGGRVRVSQSEVWSHVAEKLGQAGAASPTGDYHAVYEGSSQKFADYQERFPYPDGACGAAVLIDGVVDAIDLFDRPETLRALWPRLLRSYTVGSLFEPEQPAGVQSVPEFVERALGGEQEGFEAVGAGASVRITGDGAVGAALLHNEQLIHLSLFAATLPTSP